MDSEEWSSPQWPEQASGLPAQEAGQRYAALSALTAPSTSRKAEGHRTPLGRQFRAAVPDGPRVPTRRRSPRGYPR
ncbi:hypothetical protein GCM10010278_32580 [Streptomyces melanogenes]|nr:hypothetical protein GCM10010278_32580 [Streptomyces melanogenes]